NARRNRRNGVIYSHFPAQNVRLGVLDLLSQRRLELGRRNISGRMTGPQSRRGTLAAVTTKRALVLAGGGLAGIAWETGILRGIADESPESAKALLDADVLVGTSAGSTVA